MSSAESTPPPQLDRRVRRSRAALMRAAVDLVTERGTAAVSVTDIAEAADVSRQVLYQQFGDRDTLLLEAALDLAQTEWTPQMADMSGQTGIDRERMLSAVRHFSERRPFYRAVLMSGSGYALTKGLQRLSMPILEQALLHEFVGRIDERTLEDVAAFVTGGTNAMVNTWLDEGEDPLDPEEFTDRLMRVISALLARRIEET